MKIGIVTATDPATCKVRVQFTDTDGMVTDWLPVMQQKTLKDKFYFMPDLNEHVVCLMDENEEFGVVIGAIYSDADTPPVSSQDKSHITFDDGTTLEYDRSEHKLVANVQGEVEITATGNTTFTTPVYTINGNVVIVGSITQSGGASEMSGPVNVTNNLTAGGISFVGHVHKENNINGGTTNPPQ